jgi:hypothetical protein
MANWDTLRQHIAKNYKISKDEGDLLGLLFQVEGGRTQLVFVRKMMLGNYEWAEISTPVCKESDITPKDAMVRNGAMVVGGLCLRDDMVMFRHALPLKDLDIDEFEVPFQLSVAYGDQLEKEITGGQDRF